MLSLELAKEVEEIIVKLYIDSQLVVKQVNIRYETRGLMKYLAKVKSLT